MENKEPQKQEISGAQVEMVMDLVKSFAASNGMSPWIRVLVLFALFVATTLGALGYQSGTIASIQEELEQEIAAPYLSQIEMLEGQLADVMGQLATTELELEDLQALYNSLAEEHAEVVADLETAVAALQALQIEHAAVVAERDMLLTQVGDLASTVEALNLQIEELSSENAELLTQIQTLVDENGMLTAENMALSAQINELTAERENLMQMVADLEQQLEACLGGTIPPLPQD